MCASAFYKGCLTFWLCTVVIESTVFILLSAAKWVLMKDWSNYLFIINEKSGGSGPVLLNLYCSSVDHLIDERREII